MSLGAVSGSITNIVGMGLTAGVAFKVVDMVGDSTKQINKKSKRKRNQGIMMDDIYGYQTKRKGKGKKRMSENIFGDFGF